MGKAIGDIAVRLNPVSAKNSDDEVDLDIERVRWKAIYLSCLLAGSLPQGEREGPIGALRERVETMLQNGQLLPAEDYERCLKPLGGSPFTFPAKQEGTLFTVFEAWINDFPLFPLTGSVLGHA